MSQLVEYRPIKHFHIACGLGSGAEGFQRGSARVGNMQAVMDCLGGVDVDAAAIRDFERRTGAKGTVADLFSRDQYTRFHGKEPPAGWREHTPADMRRAARNERPNIIFISAPCKGFSGLLSETASKTTKYQALNELTLRCLWLAMEAWADDPVELLIFENVPRIATRGRHLLDQIVSMLKHYGYAVSETTHDCGELGGLAQSRKRFLLVARHIEKVPPFLYEPPKQRLRGVGEILDKMPLPGDLRAGPMHRMPALQWQTWVRLAFVEAGADWRSLNKLNVKDGILTDFGLVPEPMRSNGLGVIPYGDAAGTVIGESFPTNGKFAVADPRAADAAWNSDILGVRTWADPTGTVAGRSSPTNGAFSVADPRESAGRHHGAYGVQVFSAPAGVVTSGGRPSHGTFSVADPRVDGHAKSVQLGIRRWDQPSCVIKGDVSVGTGPYAVPDPRVGQSGPRFSNVYRIVRYDDTAPAVTGGGGNSAAAVADPRHAAAAGYTHTKYQVTAYDDASRTVIGASTTGDGAFAVADPRKDHWGGGQSGVVAWSGHAPTVTSQRSPMQGSFSVADPRPVGLNATEVQRADHYGVIDWSGRTGAVIGSSHPWDNGRWSVADPRPTHGPNAHTSKHSVIRYDGTARAVTGSDRVGSGAMSVADPRPVGLASKDRDTYANQGHYGVVAWGETSKAVPAYAKNNNGGWSVADPRAVPPEPMLQLPVAKDRLVCVIRALDGTWHRPFTTLELAALQSFFDPEEAFAYLNDPTVAAAILGGDFEALRAKGLLLDGASDSAWRERIGNAVPGASAAAIASVMAETLLLAWSGTSFMLSSRAIWVQPLQLALAVQTELQPYD